MFELEWPEQTVLSSFRPVLQKQLVEIRSILPKKVNFIPHFFQFKPKMVLKTLFRKTHFKQTDFEIYKLFSGPT